MQVGAPDTYDVHVCEGKLTTYYVEEIGWW